jgi:hypothetical protein
VKPKPTENLRYESTPASLGYAHYRGAGGFVVSRVYRDRNAINRPTEIAKSLLKPLPPS